MLGFWQPPRTHSRKGDGAPTEKIPGREKRKVVPGLNCYAWNLSISGSLLRAKSHALYGCHTGVNILPLAGRNTPTLSRR